MQGLILVAVIIAQRVATSDGPARARRGGDRRLATLAGHRRLAHISERRGGGGVLGLWLSELDPSQQPGGSGADGSAENLRAPRGAPQEPKR